MKVVLHHPVRLPPKDYGGVERVVLWLARGLLESGVQVSIVAEAGSVLPRGAELIPAEDGSGAPWFERMGRSVDLVHFMAPPGERDWDAFEGPKLLTVHGNGKSGEKFPQNTVFLSEDHARRHGGSVFVYNGLDPSEYRFLPSRAKSDWFLFLSKTSWSVKNLGGAMRMASKADVSLKIAGGGRP